MPIRGGNKVGITGQFDDQISGRLDKIRDQFDRLGKSGGAKSILQGVGMSGGIAAMNALGGAVETAAAFMADSVDKASALREALSLTEQVFEQNTGAVEAWAESTEDAFSKREALDFAAQFGTAFKNVGMTLDETAAKSQAMTTLAGDLGSAFNASSEEAANALRSGLLGESEPLRRFGVFLDEAKTRAKAMALGLVDASGELSDGAKVAARYALILEQTADSQGMFGRDTESMADAQKLLTSEIEDLQAEIGTALLPVMREVADVIHQDVIPAIRLAGDAIEENQPALELWGRAVVALARGDVPALTQAMRDAFEVGLRGASDATGDATGRVEALGVTFGRTAGVFADADLSPVAIELVGEAAKSAAGHLEDFEDAALDALDAALEAAYGPEELRTKLQLARLELQGSERDLRRLEGIKDPTRAQREDIARTRLEVIDDRKEVARLEARIKTLDGLSMSEIIAEFNKLGGKIDWTSKQGRELLDVLGFVGAAGATLGLIGAVGGGPGGGKPKNKKQRASGGFVYPGETYDVGERAPETLVMGPSGVGMVYPTGGGGASGGGAPVVIRLELDGRAVAEVVDRHLYYIAAAAPQSPYSG